MRSSSASPVLADRRMGPIISISANQSATWSGYNQGLLEKASAIGEIGFQSVSADWVVPDVTAHTSGQEEFSSAWVGIGGGCIDKDCVLGDVTLIQAGTEHDVDSSGKAHYSTWWEIAPPVPSFETSVAVAAGDSIHVEIAQLLPEIWTITILNKTQGGSFTITVPYASDFTTAEWIVETPLVFGTSGAGFASLPNLSTVRFSNAKVNGHDADLASSEAQQMVDSAGNPIATPSDPTAGGTAFDVCTYASSCP